MNEEAPKCGNCGKPMEPHSTARGEEYWQCDPCWGNAHMMLEHADMAEDKKDYVEEKRWRRKANRIFDRCTIRR